MHRHGYAPPSWWVAGAPTPQSTFPDRWEAANTNFFGIMAGEASPGMPILAREGPTQAVAGKRRWTFAMLPVPGGLIGPCAAGVYFGRCPTAWDGAARARPSRELSISLRQGGVGYGEVCPGGHVKQKRPRNGSEQPPRNKVRSAPGPGGSCLCVPQLLASLVEGLQPATAVQQCWVVACRCALSCTHPRTH